MNTKDKVVSICIFCDSPVHREQDYFNLPIERPVRIDLIVHRKCYRYHKDELQAFLRDNLEDYLEKYEEEHGEKKTPRKRAKAGNSNRNRANQFTD